MKAALDGVGVVVLVDALSSSKMVLRSGKRRSLPESTRGTKEELRRTAGGKEEGGEISVEVSTGKDAEETRPDAQKSAGCGTKKKRRSLKKHVRHFY